jgi:hypothetical protein
LPPRLIVRRAIHGPADQQIDGPTGEWSLRQPAVSIVNDLLSLQGVQERSFSSAQRPAECKHSKAKWTEEPVMSVETWLTFSLAIMVLLVIPGPTILTVISYAVARGPKANVPLVLAVTLGDATALAVSVVGLGALLATSAFWFILIKWVGGLYLIGLGIAMLRSGGGAALGEMPIVVVIMQPSCPAATSATRSYLSIAH